MWWKRWKNPKCTRYRRRRRRRRRHHLLRPYCIDRQNTENLVDTHQHCPCFGPPRLPRKKQIVPIAMPSEKNQIVFLTHTHRYRRSRYRHTAHRSICQTAPSILRLVWAIPSQDEIPRAKKKYKRSDATCEIIFRVQFPWQSKWNNVVKQNCLSGQTVGSWDGAGTLCHQTKSFGWSNTFSTKQ